ncbi:cbb3-type cytochrome oxidase subunit 3 [Extensimonas vulgaris]|jgi:cytochrome c oxidase cbb3-type subunit 4|nr:cbb3-type cytochrome c oxidase subunit 3 [Extensimonas vulgaris]TXD16496.1 cbb3-type cytochrome c oxidase subunit 3 [Extensimonas vulgaris]
MDITTLRVVTTVFSMVTFIGICVWAYLGRNRAAFEEAAHLPFEQE